MPAPSGPGRYSALTAVMSSNVFGCILRTSSCMPELSSWKMPTVRPACSSW